MYPLDNELQTDGYATDWGALLERKKHFGPESTLYTRTGELAASAAIPSTLTWRRLAGELEVEGADGPWPEGERRRLKIRLRNDGFGRWLKTRHKNLGGVWVEIHWRSHLRQPDVGTQWIKLQRDIAPGESIELEAEVRRPLDVRYLIVEPHLLGVAGFNAQGGPNWVNEIQA